MLCNVAMRPLIAKGQPLWIATRQAAYRDLLRVGRNVGMIDLGEV